MPICYQIELDITRNREGEEPYPTTLPDNVRTDKLLTPEELDVLAGEFWARFLAMMGATAPDRQGEYDWAGAYRVVSIFNC